MTKKVNYKKKTGGGNGKILVIVESPGKIKN